MPIYQLNDQNRSPQQDFTVLRSIVDAAINNGQPVFDTIKSIVEIPNVKAAG